MDQISKFDLHNMNLFFIFDIYFVKIDFSDNWQ